MRRFLPLLLAGPTAHALQVTGYTAAVNDRFSSGYASNPVSNSSSNFLGKSYENQLSAIGWVNSNPMKSVVLLSPRHFLEAAHFHVGNGTLFTWRGINGTLHPIAQQSVENTTKGPVSSAINNGTPDLDVGTLVSSVPATLVSRLPVFDSQPTSSSNSAPANSAIIMYGHGGNATNSTRLGNASIIGSGDGTPSPTNGPTYYVTNRSQTLLEGQDSGSPSWLVWTNPDSIQEPALMGIHYAIDTTNGYNFDSFAGRSDVMTAINTLMNDEGRALRCVGNTSATWQGSSTNQNLSRASIFGTNWSVTSFPADQYVLFSPTTSYRAPVVNTALNLRGLYFKSSTAPNDGFTFGGTSALTIGRGGMTNYDNTAQIFNAPLILGAPQYWDAGPGGLAITDLDTNGKLLEIRAGSSGVTMAGNISGSGSIALESGNLALSGTSSLTGKVWAHEGTLDLNGSLSAASSVELAADATLRGSGVATVVSGAGKIAQSSSRQILTAQSLQPAAGLDLDLTFTAAGSPTYGSAASSTNDVIQLKATTPLTTAFTAANVIRVFLDTGDLKAGATFRGGLYFDHAPTWSSLSAASWQIYVANAAGPVVSNGKNYSLYSAPGSVSLALVSEPAAFTEGSASGAVLQITVPPDPRSYSGWAAAAFPAGSTAAEMLPDADPNYDGVPNLLAYLLGLSPVLPSSAGLPTTTPSGGSLVYQFRQSIAPADATLTVQTSTTLASASWSTLAATPEVVNADVDGNGKTRLMRVVVPVSPETPRFFLRLHAAINP